MRDRYTCIYYFIKDGSLPLEFYMWNRQRKKYNREEAGDLSIYLPRSPAHRLGSQRQVFPITCHEWRGSNSLMPRWPFQHLTTYVQQFTRRSWFRLARSTAPLRLDGIRAIECGEWRNKNKGPGYRFTCAVTCAPIRPHPRHLV